MDVLISGASVSGPVAGLLAAPVGLPRHRRRAGPALRKAGGHAVDLFPRPWTSSSGWASSTRCRRRRTGTERMACCGRARADRSTMDLGRLMARAQPTARRDHARRSERDLYDATRDDVEYVFGDSHHRDRATTARSVRARPPAPVRPGDRGRRAALGRARARLRPGVGVRDVDRRLHRRRLDARTTSGSRDEMRGHHRASAGSSASTARRHMADARAVFLFRTPAELTTTTTTRTRRRTPAARAVRRLGWEVPRLLDETDGAPRVLLRLGHAAAHAALDARAGDARRRRRLLPRARPSAAARASPSSAPTCWPVSSPRPAATRARVPGLRGGDGRLRRAQPGVRGHHGPPPRAREPGGDLGDDRAG